MKKPVGVPLLLSARTTLPGLTVGANATPDMTRLQNQYRSHMLIDAVHFFVSRGPPANPGGNDGGAVSVRFRMGRIDLSEDFIPLWAYGPKLDDSGGNTDTEGGTLTDPDSNADGVTLSHYRWVLPRPMFVPIGSGLRPTFQNDVALDGDLTVEVAYAARILPLGTKVPAEIEVPSVSVFRPEPNEILGGVSASGNKHLYNPFTSPIRVQRFLMRSRRIPVIPARIEDGMFRATNEMTIQMSDSMGYDVVKNPTPVTEVFDINRRAWTFSRTLGPKEWFNVDMRGIDEAQTGLPQIVMMGTRKEKMQ